VGQLKLTRTQELILQERGSGERKLLFRRRYPHSSLTDTTKINKEPFELKARVNSMIVSNIKGIIRTKCR
jgi:hypothetical protein